MNQLFFVPSPHGKLHKWVFDSEPHVRVLIRRIFAQCGTAKNLITVTNTPRNAEDIEWLLLRHPHALPAPFRLILRATAASAEEQREALANAESGGHDFPDCAVPLRDYQKTAVAYVLNNTGLLLGDDLGLGKTVSALGVLACGHTLPAIVVVPTHVQTQWKEQAARFLPGRSTYIVKTTMPDREGLPKQDIIIMSYSKLSGWRDALMKRQPRTIIFDECQELRKGGTAKYNAAKAMADLIQYRVGLSATPIYNYGSEVHSVFDVLTPERLGSFEEFTREWCSWTGRHFVVNDPVALGSYLRSEGIFLRRTRADVNRELPSVNVISHVVGYDPAVIERVRATGNKLALTLLSNASFTDKGQAARQLNILLRQATGLAKATFVADFVEELVSAGESVVLGGWHREVIDVWCAQFEKKGITFCLYTGTESTAAKDKSKVRFVQGDASVMIISLRSGAGLDGLQTKSKIVVMGELDWSPKVHDQLVGRLNRDGQAGRVTAFYLLMDDGSDPVVARILGIKSSQSDGVVDMRADPLAVAVEDDKNAALARAWLNKNTKKSA